jgi:hypothetical protein
MMLFRLFSIELSETVRLFLLSTFWLASERDCGLLLSNSITEGDTVEPFETVPALSEAVEQTSSISSDHCGETSCNIDYHGPCWSAHTIENPNLKLIL